MKKLFISADIEGTTGIAHWDETDKSKADYAFYAAQMTREVNAACVGAEKAGIEEIWVKDAHSSGRNIDPSALPEIATVFRGWARHPYSMMYGIDPSFDGVVFTGYHSAAQMTGNPLSHTMNTQNNFVKINGELASELYINSLTAASEGVPILAVAGDKGLCDWFKTKCPGTAFIPTGEGTGSGVHGQHPKVTLRRIEEAVQEAIANPKQDTMCPMPKHFDVQINFKEHFRAASEQFYPGAYRIDERTVGFSADKYFDVLCFLHFCL